MIDHSRFRRAHALMAAALAVAVLGTGCASAQPDAQRDGHGGHSATSAATPPRQSASLPADVSASDVMFAQSMIPHHRQAVEMSDILLSRAGVRPDLAELARQIKTAQQPEIELMAGWLTAWGQPETMDHPMEGMGEGMLSSQQIDELRAADTATAQRLYLQGMIAHHRGAVQMAESARASSKNPAVRQLGEEIVRTQNSEIQTMQSMLATL